MKLRVLFEDNTECTILCEQMVFPANGDRNCLTTYLNPEQEQSYDNTDEKIFHVCNWGKTVAGWDDVTLDFKKPVKSYAVYSELYDEKKCEFEKEK